MKKILIIFMIFIIMLTGCNKSIRPKEVIKTDFDLIEAEKIMKRAWKPIHELTNSDFKTRPDIQVSSKEEFFDTYDFTYMDDNIKLSIYEAIVNIDKNGKEVKDKNGNLVFSDGNFINYIPTIYDRGVFIRKAYIKDSRYKEEYSYLNKLELVIEEHSNDEIIGWASGFSRKNIFRKNEDGEWILFAIEGTIFIGWDR